MKKRMLEVKKDETTGCTTVYVNSSSLSVMQKCQKKAEYMFRNGFISSSSPDQDFGTMIHKALADWYILSPIDRAKASLPDFFTSIISASKFVPKPDGKKTALTGAASLRAYQNAYKDDEYEVVVIDGKPCVEYEFEKTLYDAPELKIVLFGTIDLLVRSQSGRVLVLDHKTASTLGAGWANLWKPNHQMSAYILAAKDIDPTCNEAVINGIQVAKTKQEVMRVTTHRTEDELNEFIEVVKNEVARYLRNERQGYFPQADSYTCNSFGSCQFQELCQMTPKLRNQAVERMITDGQPHVSNAS